MFREYIQVSCPFCDLNTSVEKKGKITLCYIPSFKTSKRAAVAKGGMASAKSKSKEEYWVDSKQCPVCLKQTEELEKELKKQGII